MALGEAILAVGAGDRAASFELFSETLEAEWITQALQATGAVDQLEERVGLEHLDRGGMAPTPTRSARILELAGHGIAGASGGQLHEPLDGGPVYDLVAVDALAAIADAGHEGPVLAATPLPDRVRERSARASAI